MIIIMVHALKECTEYKCLFMYSVTSLYIPPKQLDTAYRLSHRVPSWCYQPLCDYFVSISTNSADENRLDFTLEGKAEGWLAIGFSKSPNVVSLD